MTLEQNAVEYEIKSFTKKGYTLIELLIGLGLVAILMGSIFYIVTLVQERAKTTQTQTKLLYIRHTIDEFQNKNGDLPSSLQELTTEKGGGPYLKKADLKDAWNQPFVYRQTPDGKNPYELYSFGSVGKKGPKGKWLRAFD